MSRPSPALKSASGSVSRAQCVVVVCPWRPRAVFGLSSPLSLYSFSNLFRLSFSVFGSIEGKLKRTFLEKFYWGFLNFARNLIFGRNWFFRRRRVDKIKWIECCLWAPKLCFVVVVVGRFTRQQQLLIWIFRRLVKIHNFFFFYFVDERIFFLACVVRGAFVSGPTTSREKKTTATFFGLVFVVVVCNTWASA